VYAESGWTGFTFEAVARKSGVGKPAIYRRWASRRDLLGAAAVGLHQPVVTDQRSLEADLRVLLTQMFEFSLGVDGTFWARLQLDVSTTPELQGFFQAGVLDRSRAVFAEIAARAVARGELAQMPPISFLMELGVGPINMRIAHTPAFLRARLESDAERYCARLARWMTIAILDADAAA
jgi:AcrR family transcriptional regulator